MPRLPRAFPIGRRRVRVARRILSARAADLVDESFLASLADAWGDPAVSAHSTVLSEIAREALRPGGPVVELGCGLSTLILAAAAGSRCRPVVTLEPDAGRAAGVRRLLRRAGACWADVVHAPWAGTIGPGWQGGGAAVLPPSIGLLIVGASPADPSIRSPRALRELLGRLAPGATVLIDMQGAAIAEWEAALGAEGAEVLSMGSKSLARLATPRRLSTDRLPSVAAAIVTYRRADFVRRALEHLAGQDSSPAEIVVVDASPDDETTQVCADHPTVTYVHAPELAGRMTSSRNRALEQVSADVVAFLDDDAFVRGGWTDAMREAFAEPTVAAVVGRTCNGEPGEEFRSVDEIGHLDLDGQLSANFAADISECIDVDHGIGANMAFRRQVLANLGGLRDDYDGTAAREDTDIFLRVRQAGWRAIFTPHAVCDHVAAPHVQGARFDARYRYYARRNHVLLLARNLGLCSPVLRRWLRDDLYRAFGGERLGPRRRLLRAGVVLAGWAGGLAVSAVRAGLRPLPPDALTYRRGGPAAAMDPVREPIREP